MHVPEGWTHTIFGNHINVFSGYPFKSNNYSDEACDIKLLRGDNIIPNGLRWDGVKRWAKSDYEVLTDYHLKDSDVVIAMDRTWIAAGLKIATVTKKDLPCLLVQRVACIRAKETLKQELLKFYFFSYKFEVYVKRFQTETAVPHISLQQIREFPLLLPPLAEQEKIAEILSTWDHAIEQTERLKANAETHKQALMQQLLTGKKRFPEFKGEWEEYKTKQIFKSIVRRAEGGEYEIFSVTKDGIIPQKEYFKKEIASKNTDNYKVIEFGDFVMSGLNFWMGSVDVYLEEYSGMISPAYKVYTIKKGFDISYIKHFVRSFEFNRVLVGSSILGASIVRRNFDSVAFDNWKLKLPSLEEQQKIAAILNTADREIELLAEKLDHLKTEKRALMQQLLTGKRRVKVDG